MTIISKIAAPFGGILMLAACGGSPTGNAAGDVPAAAAESGGMPANWKATDACSVLEKADVGQVLGTVVESTSLALVHEPGASDAGTSECTYMLAGGGRATVMTRWSPIADNTPDAMKAARNATAAAMKAFSDKPVEDVPGVGKSAFFVPGVNQLNAFIGDDKFIIITLTSAPNDKAKDMAIALARKAGA